MNIKQASILQGKTDTKHNSEHIIFFRLYHEGKQEKLEKRLPKGKIFELMPFHIHSFLMSHYEILKRCLNFIFHILLFNEMNFPLFN